MDIGDEGTECYIKFQNMDNMAVSLRGVREENGEEYLVEPQWDVNRTRAQKANRCGTVTTAEGTELCWGVGTSGRHRYVVTYNLSNLVKAYQESDGFNHCFYEAATPTARYAVVMMMMDTRDFDNDTISFERGMRMWGFGFHGQVRFFPPCSAAWTTQKMSSGDKIIVMMEFPKGIFNPNFSVDEPFSEVKKRAFYDSDYDMNDDDVRTSSLRGGGSESMAEQVLYTILGLLCCCGSPLGLLIYLLMRLHKRIKRKAELRRREATTPYYYDPPVGGRLVRTQLIVMSLQEEYGTEHKYLVKQRELLQALLLRLLYKGGIELTTVRDETTLSSKMAILVNKPAEYNTIPQTDDLSSLFPSGVSFESVKSMREYARQSSIALNDIGFECGLQWLLYEAAGSDHILQPDELKTYIKDEKKALRLRPYAKLMSILYYLPVISDAVDATDVNQAYGYYKYLRDFTILPERHIQEVTLWRELMVFAALFGLTKQVTKDVRRINPDLAHLDDLTMRYLAEPPVLDTIDSFALRLTDTIETARFYETYAERAYTRRSSSYDSDSHYDRSSGGGGSSSYSGGGGHSGGGGSGVR